MLSAKNAEKQIREITAKLIQLSLLGDPLNFPSNRDGRIDVGKNDNSGTLKNRPYEEIYKKLNESENYNVKMFDDALIQMFYTFDSKDLISHHLAFFPVPNSSLRDIQNRLAEERKQELEECKIYDDILASNIVTFPIRFDYDRSDEKYIDIEHPKSHVTFGQYKNCRIPVFEPLTPEIFILFILRNFYNTAFNQFASEFSISNKRFPSTISNNETKLLHFGMQ